MPIGWKSVEKIVLVVQLERRLNPIMPLLIFLINLDTAVFGKKIIV